MIKSDSKRNHCPNRHVSSDTLGAAEPIMLPATKFTESILAINDAKFESAKIDGFEDFIVCHHVFIVLLKWHLKTYRAYFVTHFLCSG